MRRYCKTPTICQMETTECGAASLAMICAYWEKHVSLEQMRIETGVSRDGCDAGALIRAAKRLGLEAHGYKMAAKGLADIALPCILYWNENHFVVLEGFKGKYAYLNDPAIGRRKLSLQEFADGYSHIVLTFRPTEQFEKVKKNVAGFRF